MVLGEPQDLQGLQEPMDHKDLRGRMEAQGPWWRRADPPRWWGFQAQEGSRVREGRRVQQGRRGSRERTGLQDLPAVTELMGHQGSLDLLESRDLRELRELQGPPDHRDHRGSMGPWECPTFMVRAISCQLLTCHPEWTHDSGNRGDQFKFMVKCKDKCRGLFMQLDHAVGDVDMYGKEGAFPQIL